MRDPRCERVVPGADREKLPLEVVEARIEGRPPPPEPTPKQIEVPARMFGMSGHHALRDDLQDRVAALDRPQLALGPASHRGEDEPARPAALPWVQ